MSVFGTRPEAIKMAPLVRKLASTEGISSSVCVTGQHRALLDQVLQLFEIKPQHDLAIMRQAQTLTHVTNAVLAGLEEIWSRDKPDLVLVHGDTSTSMAAALAAFYAGIPVGHVEAGLRTGNVQSPYPEEMNRLITSRLANFHYAPTTAALDNLRQEGIGEANVLVTGNTVIDALQWVLEHKLARGPDHDRCVDQFDFLRDDKPMALVTGHRRENVDGGIAAMCQALLRLAEQRGIQIVYPVHPNPLVTEAAERILGDCENVFLIEPVGYVPFVWLMARATLIITDSGGVQEEAPSLGVPVLVTRSTTERTEALAAGVVRLVGTDTDAIVSAALELLDDPAAHAMMSAGSNPYGDGQASERICRHILDLAK